MSLSDQHAAQAAAHAGLALRPGARVLDAISGLDGVILSGQVVHTVLVSPPSAVSYKSPALFNLPGSVVSTLYRVQLSDGTTAERDPAQLLAYPADLRADLGEFEV